MQFCLRAASPTPQVGQGVSPRRALLWSIATCLPQPLVAIPSFMFVEAFTVRPGACSWSFRCAQVVPPVCAS